MSVEFSARAVGQYLNVEIIVNDVKHDLGLLDEDQRLSLAQDLEEAAEDIATYNN